MVRSNREFVLTDAIALCEFVETRSEPCPVISSKSKAVSRIKTDTIARVLVLNRCFFSFYCGVINHLKSNWNGNHKKFLKILGMFRIEN